MPGTLQAVAEHETGGRLRIARVRNRRQWFERLMLTAPIVVAGVMGSIYRWTFDDGYIYFRTVHQLLAGNGPVFNKGERVESFTSPVWLTILTISDLIVPLQLEWIAAILAIALRAHRAID